MTNELIKTAVLKIVDPHHEPLRLSKSRWKSGDRVIHVRFMRKPRRAMCSFNLNKASLESDYEVWICGSAEHYYLLPRAIVSRFYHHPSSYPDKWHPKMRVVNINLENHRCGYARPSVNKDLSACFRATLESIQAGSLGQPSGKWKEGEIREALRKHRSRERKLRQQKIDQALRESNGRLTCAVPRCGFDFVEGYGDLGQGFTHVHHNVPLSSQEHPVQNTVDDLTIVCPNCHAMIHRWMKRHPDDVCPLDTLIAPAASDERKVTSHR